MDELKKQSLETLKSMYFHELSTKEAIHARVSVPLTTLSIVITILIYLFNEAKSLPSLSLPSVLTVLFYLGIIIGVMMIGYSAYILFRITWGQNYHIQSTPSDIKAYAGNLQTCQDSEENKAEAFVDFLIDTYCKSTNENQKNNIGKIKLIRRVNLCIIMALMICIVNSFLLYFIK